MNEYVAGVFSFEENMCVIPLLGWCFPGGWQRYGDTKVRRLKIEVFGLRMER